MKASVSNLCLLILARSARLIILLLSQRATSQGWLHKTDPVITVYRHYRVSGLAQFVDKTRHAHIMPCLRSVMTHLPGRIVENNKSEGLYIRDKQVPVPLHTVIRMIAINKQQ